MMQAYGDYDKNDLTYHSMWTALIAIKIGKNLGIEAKRQKELFMAGLLHDVGLLLIPEEILRKERESFRSEMEEIKRHPEKGHMILKKLGEPYHYLLEVSYQEHERVDGSGYPLGLKGNEIGLFPQIIGIADTYEAMTHNRPYRVRKLPLYVIKEIVETMKGKFNPKILKALLEAITLYPVGSYVRLNNKEVGRVIASMGGSHFRHVVQVLYGPDGEKLFEPRTVNLMDAHLLYIVEPVDEREFGNK
jgi:HD-GYP domain-containing protein (c-di-GMP phosphodiesterase class II)